MEKIYSKIDGRLLHIIWRESDFVDGRADIIPPTEFLQCCALKFNRGKTFRPHIHIDHEEHYDKKLAQESWVIMRGAVIVYLYDIDGKPLKEYILTKGEASFTLYGGHTYKVIEDDTFVFEYKTGPYLGQTKDKLFIG